MGIARIQNPITGACYSVAKPSHGDDQGSMVPTKSESSMNCDRERHGLFRAGAFQAARVRPINPKYSGAVHASDVVVCGRLTELPLLADCSEIDR